MVQLQLLNKILSDKDALFIDKNNLIEDYFFDYKEEFRYIYNHLNRYGQIPDIESFVSSFPEFEILNVTESKEFLVDELIKEYKTKQLAITFNNIRKDLMENNLEAALYKYQTSLEEINKSSNIPCIDLVNDTSRYNAYVERLNDYSKYYVKTGFKELDSILGGWDRTEDLVTIIGRTGNGKSWLLLKFALAAAQQGLKVGIYEGEISANKVGYRIDTLLSHIPNGKLLHGDENIQVEYKRHLENLHSSIPGFIKVLTPLNIGGPAGVNNLKAFILRENLDILFIDQHSLLEDDRKAKNPVEKASNISKDLKNLQVMLKIPIIAVAQQNRTSTENGIDTKNVSLSDRIGQDSTCVLAIEKKDNIMNLHIIKSRDTESNKKLSYYVDFNKGDFTYIPENTPNDPDNISDEEEKTILEHYSETSSGEDIF